MVVISGKVIGVKFGTSMILTDLNSLSLGCFS